ncbi:MAG: ComEC/Rec2 family competence protein, partial [Thermoanaerobaculia bacterium]
STTTKPARGEWPSEETEMSAFREDLLRGQVAIVTGGATGIGNEIASLVLGDASRLPLSWRRGLRAVGLAHLVALSGLHVGLLVGCCLVAGAVLPRGTGLALGVTAAVLFLRATSMGALAAGALVMGRRPHGMSLLAVLATVLAVSEPRLLDDLGYRLTCAATAGILWLAPPLETRWRVLPAALRRPLAMTCGAQIASLPWSLPAFKLLTPLAAGWNLIMVPWTAFALAGSLAWVLLALVWPSAAAWAAPALDLAAWPFAAVGALPPTISRPLPVLVPIWAAVLIGATLAAILLCPGRRWPWLVVALLTLQLGQPPPRGLELRMLDVGQGEAVLLRDGPAAVMVDGGGWRHGDLGGRVLVPALAAAGVRRLAAVVLSHPDLDHCRGLVDLTSYLTIGEVWTAPGWRSSPCAHELVTAPGPRLRPLWAGERLAVGRWRLRVLHPEAGEGGRGNDRSLVLMAAAPGLRVLLTGDIGKATERRLLRRWPAAALRADLLKVAHHGSGGSTGGSLLSVVRPRLALISCGLGNHYGHPAPQTLRRLEASGTRILRTDRSGEIVLRRPADGRWRSATPGAPRPD